jgi:hypothetical protein
MTVGEIDDAAALEESAKFREERKEVARKFDEEHGAKPVLFRDLNLFLGRFRDVVEDAFLKNKSARQQLERRIAEVENQVNELKADRPTLADAYKGTWQPSAFDAYERGAAVTFDGSLWLARSTTRTKPGTDDTWQMIVKRGKDAA